MNFKSLGIWFNVHYAVKAWFWLTAEFLMRHWEWVLKKTEPCFRTHSHSHSAIQWQHPKHLYIKIHTKTRIYVYRLKALSVIGFSQWFKLVCFHTHTHITIHMEWHLWSSKYIYIAFCYLCVLYTLMNSSQRKVVTKQAKLNHFGINSRTFTVSWFYHFGLWYVTWNGTHLMIANTTHRHAHTKAHKYR